MNTTEVFGIGLGAILLLSLWIGSIVLCCVSLRTKQNFGLLAVFATCLITAVVLAIPKGAKTISDTTRIVDPLFIWRAAVLLLLGLSAISGSAFAVVSFVMEVKQAKPVKSWYLQR